MIACHIRQVLDPARIKEFEHYGKVWIPLVKKYAEETRCFLSYERSLFRPVFEQGAKT